MTVCIATDGFYPKVGGISTFYKHLSDLLMESGHSVVVLTISNDEKEQEAPDTVHQSSGLVVVTLKKTFFSQRQYYRSYFRPGGYEAYQWIAIGQAMRLWLRSNWKTHHIDVVEATDYGGIGFFLCEPGLPPLAITAHGTLTQYSNYNFTNDDEQVKLIKKLEMESFHCADAIIAHSPLNAGDLRTLTNTPVLFSTAPWKTGAEQIHSNTEDYMLVIGGMQVVKGAVTMAEAVQIASEKDPSVQVRWIGPDFYVAPQQEAMSSYLQRKFPAIWGRQFLWMQQLERNATQEALKKATAVVIPSDWETFNYIALEASAFQKPVIISEGAGAVYLFNHGETAWIVPARDPQALATALLKLKGDQTHGVLMAKKAKEKIAQVFSSHTIVAERIAIFEGLIRNAKVRSAGIEQRGAFLNSYLRLYRKKYYQARALAKKYIMGR